MEHHAYIYEGSQTSLGALAAGAREIFQFQNNNDPDVSVEQIEKFGIEDAQRLKERAQLKTISGRALYVIGIASITTEAQQALLKLFEEPQRGIIFVLLVPHGALIPTLRSRMMVFPKNVKLSGQIVWEPPRTFDRAVLDFLGASAKERSAYIADLLKDEENQKERAREFISALEAELFKHGKEKKAREGLEDIAKVRSYIADRSPSLKMLLEHLALALPTI